METVPNRGWNANTLHLHQQKGSWFILILPLCKLMQPYAWCYLDVQSHPLYLHIITYNGEIIFSPWEKSGGAEKTGNLPRFYHECLPQFQVVETLINPIFLNPKQGILLQLRSPADFFSPPSLELFFDISFISLFLSPSYACSPLPSSLPATRICPLREWGWEETRDGSRAGSVSRRTPASGFVIGWLLPDG